MCGECSTKSATFRPGDENANKPPLMVNRCEGRPSRRESECPRAKRGWARSPRRPSAIAAPCAPRVVRVPKEYREGIRGLTARPGVCSCGTGQYRSGRSRCRRSSLVQGGHRFGRARVATLADALIRPTFAAPWLSFGSRWQPQRSALRGGPFKRLLAPRGCCHPFVASKE